jgi:hypothetical protein
MSPAHSITVAGTCTNCKALSAAPSNQATRRLAPAELAGILKYLGGACNRDAASCDDPPGSGQERSDVHRG